MSALGIVNPYQNIVDRESTQHECLYTKQRICNEFCNKVGVINGEVNSLKKRLHIIQPENELELKKRTTILENALCVDIAFINCVDTYFKYKKDKINKSNLDNVFNEYKSLFIRFKNSIGESAFKE